MYLAQQLVGKDLSSNKKPASLGDDPWEGKWPFTERQWVDALKKMESHQKNGEIDLNKLFFKRHSFIDEQWPVATVRVISSCMVNQINWICWMARLRKPSVTQRGWAPFRGWGWAPFRGKSSEPRFGAQEELSSQAGCHIVLLCPWSNVTVKVSHSHEMLRELQWRG